jgi:hypothetical protein
MSLALEPEIYSPSINDNGEYIDVVPSFNIMKQGIVCPCGTRKDKNYNTQPKFASHIKTKKHNKWLEQLNLNKANYYIECVKLNNVVKSQKIIIAQLQKEVDNKNITVTYLTNQLTNTKENCVKIENLLDI